MKIRGFRSNVLPACWLKRNIRLAQLAVAALAFCTTLVQGVGPTVVFRPATSIDLAGGGVGDRIAISDFDLDGNLDLVTTPDLSAPEAYPNVDGVTFLFGDGQGDFPQTAGFLAGEYLTGIATADFNGDGIYDLVTTEGFDGAGQTVPIGLCNSMGPKVPVFLGAPNGSFALQLPCLSAGRRPGAVTTGDFDEDGITDLVVTISSADVNTVDRDTYFLSGNGNGTFAAGQVFLTQKSNHITAADFNGDGHLDLAMPSLVYLGTGRGTFVAGPTNGGGEAVGDINGDGIPDVVSIGTNKLYNPADDVVRVRLGQDDGSLTAFGTPLPTGTDPNVESHPVAVAIADLNGDGYGDIVVANSETDDVAIFLRDPVGTFHPRQNVSTAALTQNGTVNTSPRGLAIADWNRDGHRDIVVSNYNPSADGTPNDGTVTVLIQDAAARPAAADDMASTPKNTAVLVDVLANDYYGSGTLDTNSITVARSPDHGSAVATGGSITYTPAADFAGVDDFSYTVSDINDTVSNLATVSVIVKRSNKLPVARNDVASTLSNASVTIDILANDNDPDGSLLPGTVVLLTQPSSGSTSIDALTGVVTYQPVAAGSYSFTYSVQDNGGASTNVATVSVSVTAANSPPAAHDDSATTTPGKPVLIYVLANDSDPDGDILDRTKIAIAAPPAHGGITGINTATGAVTYSPAAGYTGPDSFKYTVKDIRGATSNAAMVTVAVTAGNKAPVAGNDSATVLVRLAASRGWFGRTSLRPQPMTVNVLGNDSDADGALNPATVTLLTPPASGAATVNATTGAITYLPAANSFGTVSFSYTVKDNSGVVSNPATVTITVAAVKRRWSLR